MEIFAFNTEGVEYKLYDIMSAFQALKFAVNGLKNMNRVNDDELTGFELILREAYRKSDELIVSMKPILVGCDKRIVLMFGIEEEKNNSEFLQQSTTETAK